MGWCGNSFGKQGKSGDCKCGYHKVGNNECNKGFTGGGGPWRNAVYTNPNADNYLGCYKDNAARDFSAGPKQYGYTAESCMNKCQDFKYVALQDGGWCSCDNTYSTPSNTYSQVGKGECNKGFIGGGGGWR